MGSYFVLCIKDVLNYYILMCIYIYSLINIYNVYIVFKMLSGQLHYNLTEWEKEPSISVVTYN